MAEDKYKALLVVVNYFNDEEVISYVNDELKGQRNNLYVMIVNNGSHYKNKLAVELDGPDIKVLEVAKNLGYLPAFVFAVETYQGIHNSLPEFLILSNSDVYFEQKTFFQQLFNDYSGTSVGAIGPRIISLSQGIDQNPFGVRRISSSKLRLLRFVQGNYFAYLIYQTLFLLKNKVLRNQPTNKIPVEVYSIHGSFMILTGNFFSKAHGWLKKAPFLFGEELYLAEVARLIGFKFIFDPNLTVGHKEHATTGTYKSRKMIRMLYNSTNRIYEQFFINTPELK
jgi:GT2 family glycosyltransferase